MYKVLYIVGMIKAGELRIGNKVFAKEHNLLNATIEGITPNGIILFKELTTYSMIKDIEPIPLTPEILESCGFIKVKGEDKYCFGYFELEVCPMLSATLHKSGFMNFFEFDTKLDIKFLHQLQNIYFILTGNELEFNLLMKNSMAEG